jgi:hypothetical protein
MMKTNRPSVTPKGPPPIPDKPPVTEVDNIYGAFPSVGLVVSTYGSPAYVALHLESRKLYCPDVPVLVVDDCSDDTAALVDVCSRYGVAFVSNPKRLRHLDGDLAALVHGLQWGRCWGIDLLVKMSRRFLPVGRWVDDLAALAVSSQYPTITSRCDTYKFQFRSECYGVHVGSWFPFIEELRKGSGGYVEEYLSRLCRRVPLCRSAVHQGAGYQAWDYLGTDRHKHPPEWLWHNSCSPHTYWQMSRQWGLGYGLNDFTLPV